MAVRPCIERGCPEYTSGTRCARHETERNRRIRQDPHLTGGHARPNNAPQKRLRLACLARDGYACTACGRMPNSIRDLQAHHVVPLVQGGPDTLDNLTTLCTDCHSEAH